MIFATPLLAMAGVVATLVPIALHFFFRRRQKPIEWAAMELLRQAIRRTSRRRHIERLTLLILRCLVLLFAGAAISGPLLNDETIEATARADAPRQIVLVLDDGIGQQVTVGQRVAFDTAREDAVGFVRDLSPGDRVGVILAAGAQPLLWPPSDDLAAAKAILENLTVTEIPSDIAGAVGVAKGSTPVIGVMSDFRKGSIGSSPNQAKEDPQSAVKVIVTPPATVEVTNTQIIEFDPQAKGPLSIRGAIPLRVRLRREGTRLAASQSRAELTSDDGAKELLEVDWKEGQAEATIEGSIAIRPGRQTEVALRVQLVGVDAQPADDARFAAVSTSNTIHVGIVDRQSSVDPGQSPRSDAGVGRWIERALRPTDDVDIDTEVIEPTAITTQRCSGLNAVVVVRPDAVDIAGWSVLERAVHAGLIVVIVPPVRATVDLWTDELARRFNLGWSIGREPVKSDPPLILRRTDAPHALLLQISSELSDLTQPVTVTQRLVISVPTHETETILSFEDGSPFLVRGSNEGARGSLLLFAAPPDLEWTNLPAKPLMVPLFQELIRQSVAQVDQCRRMSVGGESMPIPIPGTVGLRMVMARDEVDPDDQRTIAVDPNGKLMQPITRSGVYGAIDDANRSSELIVVNIDPAAASTQLTSITEISSELNGLSVQVGESSFLDKIAFGGSVRSADTRSSQDIPIARALDGYSLAVWFFVGLLILLLVETWVARRASTGAKKQRIIEGVQ